MKKRKKKRTSRQTRTVRQTAPRRREDGRPKGTLKRFPFDETRLGFLLRYEMPVVYYLLRHLCRGMQPFEPDWRVVDSVSRASKDPSYRKPKFHRYLEEYSRNGVYCHRGKRLTPERKTYYEGIRRHKTEAFIRQNRMKLEKHNKRCPDGGILLQEMKAVVKKNL